MSGQKRGSQKAGGTYPEQLNVDIVPKTGPPCAWGRGVVVSSFICNCVYFEVVQGSNPCTSSFLPVVPRSLIMHLFMHLRTLYARARLVVVPTQPRN